MARDANCIIKTYLYSLKTIKYTHFHYLVLLPRLFSLFDIQTGKKVLAKWSVSIDDAVIRIYVTKLGVKLPISAINVIKYHM